MRSVVVAVALSLVVPAASFAATPALAIQKNCPVTGKPVNPAVSTDFQGHKVLFCCVKCVADFNKSPEKYLPALYRQFYPQRVQTTCPVMGEAVDGKTSLDFNGQRVEFCCKMCVPKFKADPAKYAAKLEADYTDQVHGPVTGQAIDPSVSTDFHGKTVYFHSADAMKAFQASPAKYADKLLPEVGVLARGATADEDLVLCAVAAPAKATLARKEVQTTVYDGKKYFLANSADVQAFKANPDKYAKTIADEMKTRQDDSAHWFTCSMHPEVLHMGPGKCPKCEMKLTPVAAGTVAHGTMEMPQSAGMAAGHGDMGSHSSHMDHQR